MDWCTGRRFSVFCYSIHAIDIVRTICHEYGFVKPMIYIIIIAVEAPFVSHCQCSRFHTTHDLRLIDAIFCYSCITSTCMHVKVISLSPSPLRQCCHCGRRNFPMIIKKTIGLELMTLPYIILFIGIWH